MVVAALAILTGQFDFGGGPVKPRRPSKPLPVGSSIVNWDVTHRELGLTDWDKPWNKLESLPQEAPPNLKTSGWFCGGAVVFSAKTEKLSAKHKARLAQIYIQFRGSAAILDPEIAAQIRLTKSQKVAVQRISERRAFDLSAFTRGINWGSFSKGKDTPDDRIAAHNRSMNMFRRTTINSIAQHAAARKQCRELLTPAQRALLAKMEGRPVRASFHETWPTLLGAFDYSGSRQGLQKDGIFSVLRHDVAQTVGLNEAQIDDITITLGKLYLDAYEEAGEYWWLLKREEEKPRIAGLRRAVFDRYEAQARKMIRGKLTDSQRAKWDTLVGKPIPGVTALNHFG